ADVRADMDTVLRLRPGRSGGAKKDGAQDLSEASEAINRLLDRPAIHGQPALLSALAGMRDAEAQFGRNRDSAHLTRFYQHLAAAEKTLPALAPDMAAHMTPALHRYRDDFIGWATLAGDLDERLKQFNYNSDQLIQDADRLSAQLDGAARRMAETAEAMSRQSRIIGYSMGILAALFTGLAAYLMGRSVQGAMRDILASVRAIKDGAYDKLKVHERRSDEIGEVGRALMVLRDRSIERDTLAQERHDEVEAREKRHAARAEHIQEFQKAIAANLSVLAHVVGNLSQTSQALSHVSDDLTEKTGATATAVIGASDNVMRVAGATDQLSVSVSEVHGHTEESRNVAEHISHTVRATQPTMARLQESTAKSVRPSG
ncbi:MAG: hypothetical protein ACRCUX_04905, partial [Beijerinckiaceae bacterium]